MTNLRNGKYSIVLSWVNTLGGIDTINFYAQSSYGLNISNAQIAERDMFQDWSNGFSTGRFDHDLTNINARARVTVRSQRLTKDQAINIGEIKISPQIVDKTKGVQVRIDRSSWNVWKDGDNAAEVSFTIEYPNIITPIV